MHKLGHKKEMILYGMSFIYYFYDHRMSLSMAMGDMDNTYAFGGIT